MRQRTFYITRVFSNKFIQGAGDQAEILDGSSEKTGEAYKSSDIAHGSGTWPISDDQCLGFSGRDARCGADVITQVSNAASTNVTFTWLDF